MKLRKTFEIGTTGRRLGLFLVSAAAFTLFYSTDCRAADGLVVHEWGTFTSVQGAEGVLMPWRPLESSALPGFVYNWQEPGLGRQTEVMLAKRVVTALQRLETPVIYFYSDKPQMVNATVKFPEGRITEWYPQAVQIGPSKSAMSSKLDHRDWLSCGTPMPPPGMKPSTEQSQATWADVYLLAGAGSSQADGLAQDTSGSHYFAARETDASLLRIGALDPARPRAETEKFIFYRGVGNFATPLRVSTTDGRVTVSNTGKEPIAKAFVLEIRGDSGSLDEINAVRPGENKSVSLGVPREKRSREQLQKQVCAAVARSLVGAGLFEREAQAMVDTWKDSWFAEEGLRVLYLLPREWTDKTLPLTITPQPAKMVRVMVGRAEIIPTQVQQSLASSLTRAHSGDATARNTAITEFQKLGRFAEPALNLATKGFSEAQNQTAWAILYSAQKPSASAQPAQVKEAPALLQAGAGGGS